MREAARSLDEQNVSNQAMTMTVTQMQRLTDQVTGAIEQQRIASRAIEHAAAKLELATQASLGTSAKIEDAARSLHTNVQKIVAPSPFVQLTAGSANYIPAGALNESKSA